MVDRTTRVSVRKEREKERENPVAPQAAGTVEERIMQRNAHTLAKEKGKEEKEKEENGERPKGKAKEEKEKEKVEEYTE